MIKDMAANISPASRGDHPSGDFAVAVAAAFGAHLTGVAFAHKPEIAPDLFAGPSADIIETAAAESEKQARDMAERFLAAAAKAGVTAECEVAAMTFGDAAEFFSRKVRVSDLAIVGQPDPDAPDASDLLVETALFESGRPIVAVPYIHRGPLKLDRVMVCWDGSRAAARAAGDALPFLLRAGAIEIVPVTAKKNPDEPPASADDMARHLTKHGLKAKAHRLYAADIDVPSVLLSYAADSAMDFMVMGGYGHSRLREFVLGGATRGILDSMTLPVLMSH
jgi:nucleotide-binding universal stress UspA family protein